MSKTVSRRKSIIERLVSYGVLLEDAMSLSTLFQKWVKESGEEWTVSRFKKLKMEYIHKISHHPKPFVAPWVRRGSDGVPSGVFRRLWSHSHYVNKPQVVLNALMIYTTLTSRSTTVDQMKKFIVSATSEPVSVSLRARSRLRNSSFLSTLQGPQGSFRIRIGRISPFAERVRSPYRRSPAMEGTAPETDLWPDLQFAAHSIEVEHLYDEFWDHMNSVMPYRLLLQWRLSQRRHRHVGVISFIQEPGYKLRAVANPNRLIQHCLEPLKRMLEPVLRQVPEDCTFDQERGVQWVQNELRAGKKAYSVDLSDATNLFPFSFQEIVLYEMVRPLVLDGHRALFDELCILFRTVSKSEWRLPGGSSLKFTAGQPLGLGPSFFSFALSHHALLYSLDGSSKYVILGDDIVITDHTLYKRYIANLANFGCKVAQEKSLEGLFAEFASRLITPTEVYRQWKWKEISAENVLEVLRTQGPRFLSQVPKYLLPAVAAIAPMPIEIGGLGWNPRGVPLQERLSSEIAQLLLYPRDEVVVIRKALSCYVSDFQTARFRALGETPDEEQDFRSWLGEVQLPHEWFVHASHLEYSLNPQVGEKTHLLRNVDRICRTDKDYGDIVVWDHRIPVPPGYILWTLPRKAHERKGNGLIRSLLSLISGSQ